MNGKAVGVILAAFFVLTSAARAYFGDLEAAEPALRSRPDVLFFGGFESDPWPGVWGMAWGPDGHGEVYTGRGAFEGHSLQVNYSKDVYGPEGGFQFLTDFAKFPIPPEESLYLRYYVRFDPGFDFVKGGKLPGLAGGAANTGGHKPNGADGWSARIMWRAGGKIVQYVYHPDQPGEYGEDLAWDQGGCPRYFTPGQWDCVETYVQMNHPGKKDGVIRSWLNGEKALEATNLRFRDTASLKIDKFYFDTFFGGGDASWASPRDQKAQFDDFVIARGPIGPKVEKNARTRTETPSSKPVAANEGGTLVFDGDNGGWTPSSWSDGSYDLASSGRNHTLDGSKSALVQLPDGKWGAVQFQGTESKPSRFKTVSLWVFPTGCNVEFRVRFELNGSQTGLEQVVSGAPPKGWKIDQWNCVELSLGDFKLPGAFSRIVLTSNSSKAVSPFYVDDLYLK